MVTVNNDTQSTKSVTSSTAATSGGLDASLTAILLAAKEIQNKLNEEIKEEKKKGASGSDEDLDTAPVKKDEDSSTRPMANYLLDMMTTYADYSSVAASLFSATEAQKEVNDAQSDLKQDKLSDIADKYSSIDASNTKNAPTLQALNSEYQEVLADVKATNERDNSLMQIAVGNQAGAIQANTDAFKTTEKLLKQQMDFSTQKM